MKAVQKQEIKIMKSSDPVSMDACSLLPSAAAERMRREYYMWDAIASFFDQPRSNSWTIAADVMEGKNPIMVVVRANVFFVTEAQLTLCF